MSTVGVWLPISASQKRASSTRSRASLYDPGGIGPRTGASTRSCSPVWFMRQAGRSLPQYREVRKQYGLFDIVRRPELCAEVTLQPVEAHGVDAAVMFTDIMFPVLGMGVDVELVENVGPVISRPIATRAEVDRLRVTEPDESAPFILEAVRLVREQLAPERAVIGFCGGPFTVAGYL